MPAFEYYMSDSVQQWLTPLVSFRSVLGPAFVSIHFSVTYYTVHKYNVTPKFIKQFRPIKII